MAILEFSRALAVDGIGEDEISMTIDAGLDERQALARRFQLSAIDSLVAEVRVRAEAGGRLYVARGCVSADVVQNCVVSLEPVPARVEESFTAVFHRAEVPAAEDLAGLTLGVDTDWDDPEPIEDGTIDVGELAAQHLSLALDPYPRAPGVDGEATPALNTTNRTSPFSVLRDLKRNEEG